MAVCDQYDSIIHVLWWWIWVIETVRAESLVDIVLKKFIVSCRVLPAYLNDMFGSHNISVCYGLILTAWSFAAIFGGFVFTAVYNYLTRTGSGEPTDPHPYIVNSFWILGCVMVGILATSCVRGELKDRLLPPVEGQWFRFRFFKTIVVLKWSGCCPRIDLISAKKYDGMWDEYCKHRQTLSSGTKMNTEMTDTTV